MELSDIPPGFGLLQLLWRNADGHACVNGFGIEVADPEPFNICAEFRSQWLTLVPAFLHEVETYVGVRVYVSGIGGLTTAEILDNLPGEMDHSLAPPQVQHIAKKATHFVGKQHRGRWYFGSVPANSISAAGELNETELERWDDFATAIFDSRDDDVATNWVILHNDASEPTNIFQFQASGTVATQRRRLDR